MTIAKKIASRLVNKLRAQPRLSELSIGELKNIEYDRQFVAVMRRYLKPESVCIDGGAHKGQMLFEMCRLAPKAAHHAFEPIPELAEQLRINFPDS